MGMRMTVTVTHNMTPPELEPISYSTTSNVHLFKPEVCFYGPQCYLIASSTLNLHKDEHDTAQVWLVQLLHRGQLLLWENSDDNMQDMADYEPSTTYKSTSKINENLKETSV